MKNFLITTMALSTICILEANHTAYADPNVHLARGGGHFSRGGEMRPIERAAPREYTGEGRGEDVSGEPHTSEASRVEDHVHTLQNEAADRGITDPGRGYNWRDGAGWGTGCESGNVDSNGECIPVSTTTIPAPGGSNSGWTTVP